MNNSAINSMGLCISKVPHTGSLRAWYIAIFHKKDQAAVNNCNLDGINRSLNMMPHTSICNRVCEMRTPQEKDMNNIKFITSWSTEIMLCSMGNQLISTRKLYLRILSSGINHACRLFRLLCYIYDSICCCIIRSMSNEPFVLSAIYVCT